MGVQENKPRVLIVGSRLANLPLEDALRLLNLSGEVRRIDDQTATTGLPPQLNNPPELIIINHDLGSMGSTGLDFLKGLRKDPLTESTPVIITSGKEDNRLPIETERFQAVFLVKPFGVEALGEAINKAKELTSNHG